MKKEPIEEDEDIDPDDVIDGFSSQKGLTESCLLYTSEYMVAGIYFPDGIDTSFPMDLPDDDCFIRIFSHPV